MRLAPVAFSAKRLTVLDGGLSPKPVWNDVVVLRQSQDTQAAAFTVRLAVLEAALIDFPFDGLGELFAH
jgi:hypothetical protein